MGSLSRKLQKTVEMSGRAEGKRVKTAQEAFAEGYKKGHEEGFRNGGEAVQTIVDEALFILFTKIATLDQVSDIGPKRYRKILDHFNIESKEDLYKTLKGRITK